MFEEELSNLKGTIDAYESDYPEGIPEESYDDYTQKIDDYNAQLETYNDEVDYYTSEIDSYNETVEEANALAEEIGSTYYVVPMPGGKH